MISTLESEIGAVPGSAGAGAYRVAPKAGDDGSPQGDLLEVSMGPHHPSTHGVFRMDVALDGETITVTTLLASQVRPIEHREIAHARLVAVH